MKYHSLSRFHSFRDRVDKRNNPGFSDGMQRMRKCRTVIAELSLSLSLSLSVFSLGRTIANCATLNTDQPNDSENISRKVALGKKDRFAKRERTRDYFVR